MDLLFASKSPWVWEEEKHFRKLKAELAASNNMDGVEKVFSSD